MRYPTSKLPLHLWNCMGAPGRGGAAFSHTRGSGATPGTSISMKRLLSLSLDIESVPLLDRSSGERDWSSGGICACYK